MSQEEPNYSQSTFNQENAVNPMGLLFDEECLRKAVEAEDKVGGNIVKLIAIILFELLFCFAKKSVLR